MIGFSEGDDLDRLAAHFGALGWQLVPNRWSRRHHDMTPMVGYTGGIGFINPRAMRTRLRAARMRLHLRGGPECIGEWAKPGVRPPHTIIAFDVDDGYAGKTGGDTMVEAEAHLGPLPAAMSCTARGPWSQSRRRWFAIDDDVIIKDSFFTEFGGNVEIIRTGHRQSWAPPGIHIRRGVEVGPIRWYDPDGSETEMPSTAWIERHSRLPRPWLDRARARAAAETALPTVAVDPQGRRPITVRHCEATVAKLTRTLYALPPKGGEFRNAVFGLAAAVARRGYARGRGETEIRDEVREIFSAHPKGLRTDADDEQWITDGIAIAAGSPWMLVPEVDALEVPEFEVSYPGEASVADVESFAAIVEDRLRPEVLDARRIQLAGAAGRPGGLVTVAKAMIADCAEGLYPLADAAAALAAVYARAGGRNPDAPRKIIQVALGAATTEAGAA
ncbi:hypothetical protein [Pseudonocardia alni]|uniref:hypothetical protein n=1 Tax=Pseudonocardia alni TaxID=33907 RepID=UPI0033310AF7